MTRSYSATLSRRQRAWTMAAAAGMLIIALAMAAAALSQVGGGEPEARADVLDRATAIAVARGDHGAAAAPVAPSGTPESDEGAAMDDAPRGGSVFRVNLNAADATQLESVPGLGKVKAKAILAWRAEHRFVVPSDLMKVKGFGPASFEKLKGFLAVDGPAVVGTPPRGTAPGAATKGSGGKRPGKILDGGRARRG
ncbi:MAG TPA: helix-hairpin-helix domain-containing protein [bacterium]|nr:helix-hairpin-helix domain-containing protein [bacterium]